MHASLLQPWSVNNCRVQKTWEMTVRKALFFECPRTAEEQEPYVCLGYTLKALKNRVRDDRLAELPVRPLGLGFLSLE